LYISVSRNYHQKQHCKLSFVVNIVINRVTCHVVVHIITYDDGRLIFSFCGSKIQVTLFYNYLTIGLLSFVRNIDFLWAKWEVEKMATVLNFLGESYEHI
jgi:hypothetical protein